MIDAAKKHLTNMNIIDKFDLVCKDIFEDDFDLPEKYDCIILSYTITTFINTQEMLDKLLSQCSKVVKDTGYLFIADFQFVSIPQDNWWAGMYTKSRNGDQPPVEFQPFEFYIEHSKDYPFEIFHIPAYRMIKAGLEAGFKIVEHKLQYPDPEVKDDKVIKRYIEECKPNDYLIKFRF